MIVYINMDSLLVVGTVQQRQQQQQLTQICFLSNQLSDHSGPNASLLVLGAVLSVFDQIYLVGEVDDFTDFRQHLNAITFEPIVAWSETKIDKD